MTARDVADTWQLIAEEGDMRVFKREQEEDGMIVDPIKAVHTVKVSDNECLQTSNISHTLGNKIVDHSDVVGASPVGAAATTSSFWT